MNRIYKVVWNKVRNCYVVVSELAKSTGKSSQDKGVRTMSMKAAAVLAAFFVTVGGGTLTAVQAATGEENVKQPVKGDYLDIDGTTLLDGAFHAQLKDNKNNAIGVIQIVDGSDEVNKPGVTLSAGSNRLVVNNQDGITVTGNFKVDDINFKDLSTKDNVTTSIANAKTELNKAYKAADTVTLDNAKAYTDTKTNNINTNVTKLSQKVSANDAEISKFHKAGIVAGTVDKVLNGVALGNGVKVTNTTAHNENEGAYNGSVAIGSDTTIKDAGVSTSVGTGNTITGGGYNNLIGSVSSIEASTSATAVGGYNEITKSSFGTALGYGSSIKDAMYSVALGANSSVSGTDKKETDSKGVISVGKTGEFTRRIINVKAGSNDTDAVNFKQVKDLDSATLTSASEKNT